MEKTTRLTQQDLQIYPSQRMTDTPDGGGLMVGQPLTGEDNEIFPPVSDVDRTMGSLDARLLYPAVLRNDSEPLYGGHFVITEPPTSENVSFLAFKARNYGESRADIMPRIEAYSVPTVESRMTLLGRHLAGVRLVQAYQRVEAPLPKVGERYCLEYTNKANSATTRRYEYFRVSNVTHEDRIFEIPLPNGQTKEITRRVVKMEITNPLVNDYDGVVYPVEGYADTPSRILETQVADSASYYGVKSVSDGLAAGDASLAVTSIYEKLVPTSTVETPYSDQYPVISGEWVATAPERVVYKEDGTTNSGSIILPHSVLPGSVKLLDYVDNGRGQLIGPSGIIQVDYERGRFDGIPQMYYGLKITARPAVKAVNARYATFIEIKDSNQGVAWAPLLQPAPTAGSLTVSYMSLGVWYTLTDNGDYVLRTETGKQVGSVSDTGSVILTLPAQPDIGSKIVLQWGDADVYRTFDAQKAGHASAVTKNDGYARLPQERGGCIKPGSYKLAWGSGKSVTDVNGKISGSAEGWLQYADGGAMVRGVNNTAVQISYDEYTAEEKTGSLPLLGDGAAIDATIGKTAPGSLVLAILYQAKASSKTGRWVQVKYNGQSAGNNFRGGVIAVAHKHDLLIEYPGDAYSGQTLVKITDNGVGGLMVDGMLLKQGSIDYATGRIRLPDPTVAGIPLQVTLASGQRATVTAGAKVVDYDEYDNPVMLGDKTIAGLTVTIRQAAYAHIPDTATRRVIKTETPSNITASVLTGASMGTPVLNSWAFSLDGAEIIERNGTLYANWDYRTGTGRAVGHLSSDGLLTFGDEETDYSNLMIVRGLLNRSGGRTYSYSGRTEAAPVKPGSFTVFALDGGTTLSGRSDAEGNITGDITGKIDYETGFYDVNRAAGFSPDSLRYNAVTQDNLPLDSSIIGIDAVRLPADGRVPVFRKGDMIVISNRLKQDLGSAFTAAQKITLKRQNIDRLCLVDSKGKHVLAEKYTADLKAGSITFAEPLDLSQYSLPLTAVCAWEEENRVTGVDISGRLKLQFAIGRNYPKEDTFVSSALIGGDLLVRTTEPFSQQAWDNVWSDAQRGEPILARVNVKDYPIKLASNGAITERWLIKFVTATQFELYGERLGLVAKSDTLTDFAPTNSATGKPYFTLKAAAFGGGWSTQNCIRFNTYGTPLPVWILRSVQPSPDKQNGRDGFTACLRGNTVAE